MATGFDLEECQMVKKNVTHVTAVLVSLALVIASSQNQSVALAADAATPTQAAPMSQSELRALVAPIALYPDNLVAEILAASTFPDQIAEIGRASCRERV